MWKIFGNSSDTFFHKKSEFFPHFSFPQRVQLERVGEKWEVTTTEGNVDRFDFAMLCTGHHTYPRSPQIKGKKNNRVNVTSRSTSSIASSSASLKGILFVKLHHNILRRFQQHRPLSNY